MPPSLGTGQGGSSPRGLLAGDEILLSLLQSGTGAWGWLSVEVDQVNSRALAAQLLGVFSVAETTAGIKSTFVL